MQRGSNESPISDADSRKPAQPRSHWPRFYRTVPPCIGLAASAIHRVAEKAHSRKLVVASPATNIPSYSAQSTVTRAPAAFWRDIAAPAARICYEELQVVAAELPENESYVSQQGLCRPTHYTGLSSLVGSSFWQTLGKTRAISRHVEVRQGPHQLTPI